MRQFLWNMEELWALNTALSTPLLMPELLGSGITRMAIPQPTQRRTTHYYWYSCEKKKDTLNTFLSDLRKHVSMQNKRYSLYYAAFKENMMPDCCPFSVHWLHPVNPNILQLFFSRRFFSFLLAERRYGLKLQVSAVQPPVPNSSSNLGLNVGNQRVTESHKNPHNLVSSNRRTADVINLTLPPTQFLVASKYDIPILYKRGKDSSNIWNRNVLD